MNLPLSWSFTQASLGISPIASKSLGSEPTLSGRCWPHLGRCWATFARVRPSLAEFDRRWASTNPGVRYEGVSIPPPPPVTRLQAPPPCLTPNLWGANRRPAGLVLRSAGPHVLLTHSDSTQSIQRSQNTQYSVRATQYSFRSTRYSARSTQYSVHIYHRANPPEQKPNKSGRWAGGSSLMPLFCVNSGLRGGCLFLGLNNATLGLRRGF